MSKATVPAVEEYIRRQKEHHHCQDFQTEFLELLRRHGMVFDQNEVFRYGPSALLAESLWEPGSRD